MPPSRTPRPLSPPDAFKSTAASLRTSEPATPSPRRIRLPPSPEILEEDAAASPRRLPSPATSDTDNDLTMNSSPTSQLPYRPRNSSPSNTYLRPHSAGDISQMPLMQRAHSSPGIDSSGRILAPRRPASPLSSGRRRSPLRSTFEDLYPSSWTGLSIEPNIPEHEELEISSPLVPGGEYAHMATLPSYSNTFPRTRRKPHSPLHQSASAPSLHARAASPYQAGGASPFLSASKYANEPYPAYPFSTTSSMPSTPTSFRSRSPSISSLETIEDTPDAEEAALMEDDDVKQRGDDSDGMGDLRRRSLDSRGPGLRSNKDRKRWSVCGAERRADFSLEVIEE